MGDCSSCSTYRKKKKKDGSCCSKKVELPEDCRDLILNRLALDDLQSLSLVCKQFLSITNSFRRKLVADKWNMYHYRFEPIFRALQRFPNLEEIDLCLGAIFCDGTDYLFEKIAASPLKHLQALSVRCFYYPPSSSDSFRKLGSAMNNLKVLRCSFPKSLRDYDLVAISDALPCLEELDIHTTQNNPSAFTSTPRVPYPQLSDRIVTDAGIEVISRKLQGLRKIDISWNHACSDRSLIALSSNCGFLNEIRCSHCSITGNGIFSLLHHSPNLISLEAGNCYKLSSFISTFDESSTVYTRALRVLDLCVFENLDQLLCSTAKAGTVPLEKLILRSHSTGDGHGLSLHGLSTFLRACPSLKHLELEGLPFLNDHSMKDLCPYLPSVESIKLLRCSSNLITITIFFILAKQCPSLSEIVLISNHHAELEDVFVMDADADVERNDQITSLELKSNLLNDRLLKRVGVVCPNLRTLDIKGCYRVTKEGIGEILHCCSRIKHLRMAKRPGMGEILFEQFKTRDIVID